MARRELEITANGPRVGPHERLRRRRLQRSAIPDVFAAAARWFRPSALFGIAAVGLCACQPAAVPGHPSVDGGDPAHGRALIEKAGCGGCHQIPGVTGAAGQVGPSLARIGVRTVLAGVLPNTPENMALWVRTPQSVIPGNAMPNTEIDDHDARDVAAYLYTLR